MCTAAGLIVLTAIAPCVIRGGRVVASKLTEDATNNSVWGSARSVVKRHCRVNVRPPTASVTDAV